MTQPSPRVPSPLEDLLRTIEGERDSHDAAEADHRRKRRNLDRATAELVQLMILSGQRRRVLEIGTSTGYSALWIADALRRIPGASPLITVEREPSKADQARANFERAGLANWVEVRVGDATSIVNELTGPFDAVFFDADRRSAPDQLALLLPRLAPDTLLMTDNVLSHPDEVQDYLDAVARLADFASVVVPIGKGLHLAHRLRTAR